MILYNELIVERHGTDLELTLSVADGTEATWLS